ncbi:MAG: hypothetical protein QMC83_09865 [Thermodesulfovibrionales bacterium]|nr:hypothetical protein [Thermodesulfovibrionales bacterium]
MNILQEAVQLSHNPNLDSQLVEGRKVSKKHLINTLNYINFQDGTILINLKHQRYSRIISLQAKPQPCLGDSLDCFWVETAGLKQKLKLYKFLHFVIADGQKMILVKPDVKRISEEGIGFDLPETCYEICSRKVRRHLCEGIHVELIQNGVKFHGSLLDFSAVSFRVEASAVPPQSFQWINPESPVFIIFKNRQEILYSGECTIIRQTLGKKTRAFILEPLYNQASRFGPKECRSPRHKLSPSLNIIFEHPLTRNLINLKVEDLSGSGFSVEEHYDNLVLLPGMVIPQMELEFANTCRIYCRAQVVYRNVYKTEEGETYVKSGIAILDMNIQDQVKLSSLLHQMTDRKSYVCTRVDLNALWKFFFEAGFVYPKKYASMHTNKEKFKETYEKLYIESPTIARHFMYQDRGIIQGHISMLRFYENTWLFHHHAASGTKINRAGLVVLDQIARYVNDFYCLYSTHMDFVICYFRPDNKFPNRVFGGFTRELKEPKGSSLDPFAYFYFPAKFNQSNALVTAELVKTQPEDLMEMESFYEYNSGGLMVHALDLEPDMIGSNELNKEYRRLGFKRERHLFSLKQEGALKAIIVANLSDTGLNLSNLTNCIHVFVLDSDDLSPCCLT